MGMQALYKLASLKTAWILTKNVPGSVQQSKEDSKKDAYKLLYLETDASGVSQGPGLLQIRDDMNCRYYEVPDNAALHPIAFTRKSLSRT